jgi:hypothetical protein
MGIPARPEPDHSQNHPSKFPHVRATWSEQELRSLIKLIFQPAGEPTATLIRAMKEAA